MKSSPPSNSLKAVSIDVFLTAVLAIGLVGACSWMRDPSTGPLKLIKDDSIVFIGNTFAERMHLFGYFETLLHASFPDHQLRVRNMGWSADELTLMPRPKGFGDIHRYLAAEEANVVFACFGLNESFKGSEGLGQFKEDLDLFIQRLQTHQYSGQSATQIVIVSPVAHEDLDTNSSDAALRNEELSLYTEAMAEAAWRHNVLFVDLFAPTRELMDSNPDRNLTLNGIHLTEYGYWKVSQIMARSLGLVTEVAPPNVADNATAESLRRTIYEKNYFFFIRWRGPNAEYIHGERNQMGGAENLLEEMAEYDQIIDAYDRRIWAMAKPVPDQVWQRVPQGVPVWHPTPQFKDTPPRPMGPDEYQGIRVLSPQEALEAFRLPDGYAINLFASEQEFPIANPMALNFDAEGRLWVANTPTWPQPIPGEQPSDSIIILEDTDRDGVADKHTVFIDKLDMIHGFALGDGGAYISQVPHILHAQDTDGDLRADKVRMELHGFGSEDVEHSINNFRWGPDGAVYFMEGTFFHTQVETPYGPRRLYNSGVFRYMPRSQRFDVLISHRFANPWGQVFDHWGQWLLLDASGGNYYSRPILTSNFVYPKRKERWRGKPPLSFAPEGTAPSAGIEIIRNRHFPEQAQGRFLVNELSTHGFLGTYWYDIKAKGTSYEAQRVTPHLVSTKDPFYRPTAMAFGPDGAMYVLDFSSPVIENTAYSKRDPGRDHSRGRVWRITYPANPLLQPPRIVGRPSRALLDLLKEYENTTRHLARRELQQRDPAEIVPALEQWLATLEPADPQHERLLLEALWIYQGLEVVEPDLLYKLLQAEDYRAREAATRVLRYWQDRIDNSIDWLARMVEDEHIRVRMEAVLACGFSSSARAAEVALQAARFPMDAGMQKALGDTMDFFERSGSIEP